MGFQSKSEMFREAEARFERTEPFRPSLTKPISDMSTEEIVAALHPCVCNHLTTDHDVRGWCAVPVEGADGLLRFCTCIHYIDATVTRCKTCGSESYMVEHDICPDCENAWSATH